MENNVFDQKLNEPQMQQLCNSINNAHERISELQNLHNDLNRYVRITVYSEIEKCKKQNCELQRQLQNTSESKYEYMFIDLLSDYLPSRRAPSTIRAWCKEGKIPYHKMGKVLFFYKDEIDNWLKNELCARQNHLTK